MHIEFAPRAPDNRLHVNPPHRKLASWQQATLSFEKLGNPWQFTESRMREIPEWQLFWPSDPPLSDPFLRELMATRPVQRLRHIGFLGAIDYLVHGNGRAAHRRRHNRFDHSVNVALLAFRYATLRDLSDSEVRILTAAALLHDVGHGPLSHTLEPTFHAIFGIDHHQAGRTIVEGQSPLGSEIPHLFTLHGVDLDEVLALINGAHGGPHAFLFDSPMNFDTIEAIARCCLFTQNPQSVPPTEFVDAIATQDDFPIEMGDRFWSSKQSVYRNVIGSRQGLVADTLAQQYMAFESAHFQATDFYLDDTQLRRRHPRLFALFEALRTPYSGDGDSKMFCSFDLDLEVEAAARRFTVNHGAAVRSPQDLAVRYTQHKKKRKLQLKSLVREYSKSDRPLSGEELEFL